MEDCCCLLIVDAMMMSCLLMLTMIDIVVGVADVVDVVARMM